MKELVKKISIVHKQLFKKKKYIISTNRRQILVKALQLQEIIDSTLSILINSKIGRIWVQPELLPIATGYYEEVAINLSDERFKKKYRLDRESYHYVCDAVREQLQKCDTTMRNSITVEKRVLISLHVLKTTADYDTVAGLYRVGKSTVGTILREFCDAIITVLYQKEIKFPTSESERAEMSRKFSIKSRFPGVFGALDGSHIPIKAPKNNPDDYFNYKKYHSINVLAMVDSDYIFRYINTGRPGSVHDAAVFRDSNLFQFFEEHESTNFHILADGAFPLKNWLLKPYPGRNLSPIKRNFNYRLSSCRMVVENSFGRLKGRFRILSKKMELSLENSKRVIKTCIVLNNICEKNKCKYHPCWEFDNLEYPEVPQPIVMDGHSTSASAKRDSLARTVLENTDER